MSEARQGDKPYGLAVKAIIADESGRVLLLRRSAASKHWAGTWEFPGGKVDSGEAFDAALLREVAEETGLTVTLDRVAGATHYEMPAIRLAVLFVEASLVAGQVHLSDEHDGYKWVQFSELGNLDMSEQLKPCIAQYIKQQSS